uniref:Uncharacterized protein n=1 Tax=Anopheles quadriannulatus TaxID=34691 RepID=A0A182XTS6_ANOQN
MQVVSFEEDVKQLNVSIRFFEATKKFFRSCHSIK